MAFACSTCSLVLYVESKTANCARRLPAEHARVRTVHMLQSDTPPKREAGRTTPLATTAEVVLARAHVEHRRHLCVHTHVMRAPVSGRAATLQRSDAGFLCVPLPLLQLQHLMELLLDLHHALVAKTSKKGTGITTYSFGEKEGSTRDHTRRNAEKSGRGRKKESGGQRESQRKKTSAMQACVLS